MVISNTWIKHYINSVEHNERPIIIYEIALGKPVFVPRLMCKLDESFCPKERLVQFSYSGSWYKWPQPE